MPLSYNKNFLAFSEYKTNFVKTMLELGEKNKILNIIDDQLGSPTYAVILQNSLGMLLSLIILIIQ